jgi:hypothetical protein
VPRADPALAFDMGRQKKDSRGNRGHSEMFLSAARRGGAPTDVYGPWWQAELKSEIVLAVGAAVGEN